VGTAACLESTVGGEAPPLHRLPVPPAGDLTPAASVVAATSLSAGPAVAATSVPGRLLTLQRMAGNAAVGRLLAERPAPITRVPFPVAARATPAPRHAAALDRAVADRRLLQRMPAFHPNPSWSQVGPGNPPPTCTPFGTATEAEMKWRLYNQVLPGKIQQRCGCADVTAGYAQYLTGTGGSHTVHDDGNCISQGLAAEDDPHTPFERARLTAWGRVQDDMIRRSLPAGQTDVDLDLLEAEAGNLVVAGSAAARPLQVNGIEYRDNTKSGGLMFGGGHVPGAPPDSECGDDTRVMTATVHLHRTDDGSNPTRMEVTQTFTFRYALHDALDFCPGNTVQMHVDWTEPLDVIAQRVEYNQLLTDLSRLEASGMTRDVCYDVEYHRTLPVVPHTVPVTPPPAPAGPVLSPTGTVVADVLQVRGGPGTGFPIVGRVPSGRSMTFDCFSHGESIRGDDAWCRVAGTSTWVSHSYIADSGTGRLPACP
jgi:hypothetical protein